MHSQPVGLILAQGTSIHKCLWQNNFLASVASVELALKEYLVLVLGELTLQCTGVISKGEHGSHRLVPANTDLLGHGSAKDLIWKGGFTVFL